MNSLFKSGCQRSTPSGAGGGDDGIKLTPDGDEDGRPTSMVLRLNGLTRNWAGWVGTQRAYMPNYQLGNNITIGVNTSIQL
jgi:hypothetical protein